MKKLISIILALVMLLALVACGSSEGEEDGKSYKDVHGDLAKEAEEKLPQYILEAIRAYYGLDFGAELTDKMVASVETLTIDIPAVTAEANMVYIDAAVNGSKFSGFAVRAGGRVYPERMKSIHKLADEFSEKVANDPDTYTEKLAEYLAYVASVEEWCETNISKFKVYSALIDINAEGLLEEDKTDILEKYPDIKETGPFYVYEEISAAEAHALYRFFTVFTEAETRIPTGEIDLSCLEAFPNLKSVKCDERFNAKNCPVKLETLSVDYLGGHYKCGDNLTWKAENELLTITGSGDMWDFTGKGTPWTSDIRFLVIENGVTSIGADAFSGWAVQSATIPDSVTKISNRAFNDDHLKEITFEGTKSEWEALFDGEALYKDLVVCSDGRF